MKTIIAHITRPMRRHRRRANNTIVVKPGRIVVRGTPDADAADRLLADLHRRFGLSEPPAGDSAAPARPPRR